MNSVNFVNNSDFFNYRRDALNGVLSFSVLELVEDGKIRKTKPVYSVP